MSAVLSDLPYPPATWRRPALALAVLMLGIVALYFDTARMMVGVWSRSDTFAHAFLVPPISAWLVWRDRDRLTSLVPRPSLPWLLPLLLGALAWLVGDVAGVNALSQFALVLMLVVSVPLMLGGAVARAMLFPLLFLFFCVPVGEFLLPLLMEATADFTVAAVRLSGVPVYREGLQFVIPTGYWSVVEACSGVRYLIASLMVGSLFAYINYQSLRRRLVFVAVSIVVPIVANWIRAYIIVMLGHLSNNRIATGVDHLVYGWVFFGIVITIMFVIGARWSEPDRARVPAPAAGSPLAVVPVWAVYLVPMAGVLAILALPPVVVTALQGRNSTAPVQLSLPQPADGGWVLSDATPVLTPRYGGAAAQAQAVYAKAGRRVGVYVAYYRRQDAERKLVSSTNILVPSQDNVWNAVSTTRTTAPAGPQAVSWRSTSLMGRVAAGGQAVPFVAWQSYWIDDRWVDGDARAKVEGARALLSGRGDDGAVLILHTEGEPATAGPVLSDFLSTQLPALQQALQRARDQR
jgi:exosortase A